MPPHLAACKKPRPPSRVATVSAFLTVGKVLFCAMSHVYRLRATDRIFFVTVPLRRSVEAFCASEYPLLVDTLDGSRRRLGFLLGGWVRMPDHGHALIGTFHPLTISQIIHDVKKVLARRLHKRRGTNGPVWQHQFWDRLVRHGKEFGERLEYMHLNPVRKGLLRRPGERRWSSYNNFALDENSVAGCPLQIDYLRLPEGYRA
jgi:putative transposase